MKEAMADDSTIAARVINMMVELLIIQIPDQVGDDVLAMDYSTGDDVIAMDYSTGDNVIAMDDSTGDNVLAGLTGNP